MDRASECWLLHENPQTHGVFDERDISRLHRYCTIRSASRNEAYSSMSVGLRAERVLKLALSQEYDEQLQLEWNGKVYNIIRAYETQDGGVELTIQRSDE